LAGGSAGDDTQTRTSLRSTVIVHGGRVGDVSGCGEGATGGSVEGEGRAAVRVAVGWLGAGDGGAGRAAGGVAVVVPGCGANARITVAGLVRPGRASLGLGLAAAVGDGAAGGDGPAAAGGLAGTSFWAAGSASRATRRETAAEVASEMTATLTSPRGGAIRPHSF
jgi:hypothetical protein